MTATDPLTDGAPPRRRHGMEHRLGGRLAALDRRIFELIARRRLPVVGAALPKLSRAADHGVLWVVIGTLLSVWGRRPRRAAARGVIALLTASLIANLPSKWLADRRRPSLEGATPQHMVADQPRTSSFPSGHAASAFAFGCAASLEAPALAPALLPLAAAVAYSRVYIGAHYPGDVVAGALLGVVVGLGSASVAAKLPSAGPEHGGTA